VNERTARDVALVRALETADGAREIWGDEDRAWAGRAAAEAVGGAASSDAFLGERARRVIERLSRRYPKIAAVAELPHSRRWMAPALAIGAFVVGAAGVEIGSAHRINLLAPPVLGLLAWNIAVYVALIVAALRHARRPSKENPRSLRRTVATWLRNATAPSGTSGAVPSLVTALARFSTDWSALAAPLWRQRAARLLHLCAALLAAGAIAGLYVRGIALEYRASWQSTFLDATDIWRLLNVALAPGAWVTGIPVPGIDRLRAIGSGTTGENAAPWIHLYAGTLLVVVIVPRLVLGAVAWLRERRLARRFPIALDHAYFQRLIHGWREGASRIACVPYSYDLPDASADGLAKILLRVFQTVDIDWLPVVRYGDEALAAPSMPLSAVIAVFALTATPEPENQGAFVRALGSGAWVRAPLAVIVDTSDFIQRFEALPQRLAQRQQAWRDMLAAHGVEPLFVRLAAPPLQEAASALAALLEQAKR
jgi:hypothetical protein